MGKFSELDIMIQEIDWDSMTDGEGEALAAGLQAGEVRARTREAGRELIRVAKEAGRRDPHYLDEHGNRYPTVDSVMSELERRKSDESSVE